ncbi:MAG: EF-hand domain-containing protein [Mariprofundales bacterium]
MKKVMIPLLFIAALVMLPISAIADHHDGANSHSNKAEKSCGKKVGSAHFKKMDTNNNGTIDAKEHASHAAIMFSNMDVNKDGKVTKDEMRAHWKAKRGQYAQCRYNQAGKHKHGEHDSQ